MYGLPWHWISGQVFDWCSTSAAIFTHTHVGPRACRCKHTQDSFPTWGRVFFCCKITRAIGGHAGFDCVVESHNVVVVVAQDKASIHKHLRTCRHECEKV